MKNLKFLLLIIIGISLERCGTQQPKTTPIARIKNLLHANALTEPTADSDIYVEGFYYKDPVPILITDLKYARINTIMPDSVFLVLPNANELSNRLEPLQGQRIRIKGTIQKNKSKAFRQANELQFIIKEVNALDPNAKPSVLSPKNIRLKNGFVPATNLRVANSANYALLYSGGYDINNAHIRYWNDLKLMYQTLKTVYGYSDDHIIVIYKSGQGEDTQMPVNYPASQAGLKSAFEILASKLNKQKNLFVFFTNHGGGYHTGERANEGGVTDISGDETDPYHMDEVTYYYNQSNNIVLDDEIASKINTLKFNKLIVLMEPCFGGGFLRDLRGVNRIIMSAASEFEYSYSNNASDYDVFSYFFTTALASTLADANHDGKISMLEAFLYARTHDQTGESPGLEDNGDGIGLTNPSPSSTDGSLASKTFLF